MSCSAAQFELVLVIVEGMSDLYTCLNNQIPLTVMELKRKILEFHQYRKAKIEFEKSSNEVCKQDKVRESQIRGQVLITGTSHRLNRIELFECPGKEIFLRKTISNHSNNQDRKLVYNQTNNYRRK